MTSDLFFKVTLRSSGFKCLISHLMLLLELKNVLPGYRITCAGSLMDLSDLSLTPSSRSHWDHQFLNALYLTCYCCQSFRMCYHVIRKHVLRVFFNWSDLISDLSFKVTLGHQILNALYFTYYCSYNLRMYYQVIGKYVLRV